MTGANVVPMHPAVAVTCAGRTLVGGGWCRGSGGYAGGGGDGRLGCVDGLRGGGLCPAGGVAGAGLASARLSLAPAARAEVVRYRPDALSTNARPIVALPHKPAFEASPGSVVALYREVARREVTAATFAAPQIFMPTETVAPLIVIRWRGLWRPD